MYGTPMPIAAADSDRRVSRSFISYGNSFPLLGLVIIVVLVVSIRAMALPYPEFLEQHSNHTNAALSKRDDSKERALYRSRFDPQLQRNIPAHTHLDVEICHFLYDDECEDIESSFRTMAAKTRSTIAQSADDSLVRMSGNEKDPSKPKLRTLVVMVCWQGHEERREWMTRDMVDRLWNGVGTDETVIPTGSIKNYTETQAYHSIEFFADVLDWRLADNTEAFYADGRMGLRKNGDNDPDIKSGFHYILNQMEAEGFPWEDYDSNDDGYIDHIQFVHSGYGAESGGIDCHTGSPAEDRIWSHAMPEGRGKWISLRSGKELGGYSTSSVFHGRCDKSSAHLGIITHEFYHTIGLPDLYDKDQPNAGIKGKGGIGGLGVFDMMASPFGTNNNQKYPGSLSPWSKLEIGFLQEAIEITKSGTYTARPSNDFPDIYSIRRGFQEGEQLLLENRQNKGFDATLWTGGILAYKIDETLNHNGNRNHGFPGQVNVPEEGMSWPSNGRHYPIALLQADGKYDLEQGINNGDRKDFYRFPNQKLASGNGELVATEQGVYPNTDSYALGEINTTGIVIDQFQQKESGDITFRVTFADDPPPTPPTKTPTSKSDIAPTQMRTKTPTENPSTNPTTIPTKTPTTMPSMAPVAISITQSPTLVPTQEPSQIGSQVPTNPPTKVPTMNPTDIQEDLPTIAPSTEVPTKLPTSMPTNNPATNSTSTPTRIPTANPTNDAEAIPPTHSPTQVPTQEPSKVASQTPTNPPTTVLSMNPTDTMAPSTKPPTSMPTNNPSESPSALPTVNPTGRPTTTASPTIATTSLRGTTAPVSITDCSNIIYVWITTDAYPNEITWEITTPEPEGRFLIGYKSPKDLVPERPLEAFTEYNWKICALAEDDDVSNFVLRIFDDGGDGIRPPGKYSLGLGDGRWIVENGTFQGSNETVKFSTSTE